MKNRVALALLISLFAIAPIFAGKDGGHGQDHNSINDDRSLKGLKIRADEHGAMVIKCDPAENPGCHGAEAVVVPVDHPKAKEALERHSGKSQTTPPPSDTPPPPPCKKDTTRLIIHDALAGGDSIANRNGFVVLRSNDRFADIATSYAVYGMIFFSPPWAFPDIPNCTEGQCFNDGGIFYGKESSLVLVLINSFAGDGGPMMIQPGESINFTYDAGQAVKITFSELVEIAPNGSMTLFVSAPDPVTGESRLYWDYNLTVPHGTLPADYCPL